MRLKTLWVAAALHVLVAVVHMLGCCGQSDSWTEVPEPPGPPPPPGPIIPRFGCAVNYQECADDGPDQWWDVCNSPLCRDGSAQSPINIQTSTARVYNGEDMHSHYHPLKLELEHLANTIEELVENLDSSSSELIFGGPLPVGYHLLQFHFHTPSEHTIDGRRFPLETHFVHINRDGAYSVLAAVFQDCGTVRSQLLDEVTAKLDSVPDEGEEVEEVVDPSMLFEDAGWDYSVYSYNGSFTTPPCTEGVIWMILSTPLCATAEQMAVVQAVHSPSARPLQPRNARHISFYPDVLKATGPLVPNATTSVGERSAGDGVALVILGLEALVLVAGLGFCFWVYAESA